MNILNKLKKKLDNSLLSYILPSGMEKSGTFGKVYNTKGIYLQWFYYGGMFPIIREFF
jgi:hypothetical protein